MRVSRTLRAGAGWGALAAVVMLLGSAWIAQALITGRSDSTLLVGTTTPPVTFSEGSGALRERFIERFELSANRTAFAAEMAPRIGATVNVKDVARITNDASEPRSVTLRGTSIANADVETFEWRVKEGAGVVATLDMRAGTPSTTISLPAGATFELDLRVRIAKGASVSSSAFSFDVWEVIA